MPLANPTTPPSRNPLFAQAMVLARNRLATGRNPAEVCIGTKKPRRYWRGFCCLDASVWLLRGCLHNRICLELLALILIFFIEPSAEVLTIALLHRVYCHDGAARCKANSLPNLKFWHI